MGHFVGEKMPRQREVGNWVKVSQKLYSKANTEFPQHFPPAKISHYNTQNITVPNLIPIFV